MKTHVVLIDFENVQKPHTLGPLSGGACQIKVFVGRQSKLPLGWLTERGLVRVEGRCTTPRGQGGAGAHFRMRPA